MAEYTREECVAFLRALDDDDLRDYRFQLYDAAEGEDEGSEIYESVRSALELVAWDEARRVVLRGLALAHLMSGLDGDSVVFAEALPALARARRELDLPDDAGEVFAAALEVASAAQTAHTRNEESK